MKKLKIGMVALLMIVGSMAWAQNSANSQNQKAAKTAEERATAHSNKLTKDLGLSQEQQKSVYTLCLQRAQQEDADRAKFQNDKEGMRNARKQNEGNFETNLAKVLTADQKTKFEQMKQAQKEKHKEKSETNSEKK
jgi:Ni/Co efflux regulator RcnB